MSFVYVLEIDLYLSNIILFLAWNNNFKIIHFNKIDDSYTVLAVLT